MSKTYVIFLANGQNYDIHNVDSIGYTGAEGHQKNMMLSDPDGNILAMLSENHHGLLYKGPTNPEDVPRFPVAAPASAAAPQSVETPIGPATIVPTDAELHAERHRNNAIAAKGYTNGYTRGEQDRALRYDPQTPCPLTSDAEYWDRQGWGDGYHGRGFHIPQN